jgi:hypothetical protein
MNHQIIDNFLPNHLFIPLKSEIVNNKYFSWNHISSLNSEQKTTDLSMYLIHMVYLKHEPLSYVWENFFRDVVELLPELKALIRIKINFYPVTSTLTEHAVHTDDDFTHKGAVLSLTTCDGYTKLEDGTKIDSVENRLVIFDAGKPHNSTSTTTPIGRYNINFNYI